MKNNNKPRLAMVEYENSSIHSPNPTLPAYVELSRLYLKNKEINKAFHAIQELIKREPDYPDGIYMMAVISYHLNHYKKSLSWYSKYLGHIPQNQRPKIKKIMSHINSLINKNEKHH